MNIYFCQIFNIHLFENEVCNKTSIYIANLLNHVKLSLFVLYHYFSISYELRYTSHYPWQGLKSWLILQSRYAFNNEDT